MARSLYRLMECTPDGGFEWWGWFDSDTDAVRALVATFKERQRFWRNGDNAG